MAMSEYICAQCWHSFEADADESEVLKCPNCGAEQPSAGGQSGSSDVDTEVIDENPAIPEAAVEQPIGEAIEGSPENETAADPEEDEGDWLDGVDPAKCGWRVRSGVLTYNFHGIDALQNWCSGKKGLDTMEVSIESIGIWRNLSDFRRLLRKQDPITAFREMGLGDEKPAGKPEAVEAPERKPMEPVAQKSQPVEAERASTERSVPKQETVSRSSREDSGLKKSNKPSVRSTGEFTFKVGEAPSSSGSPLVTFGGGFVVGLLFGLVLWYLGLLGATGIEPMSLF